MIPDSSIRYTRPDHVLLKSVGEELLLLNVDNETYYSLNAVGVQLYEGLEEGKSYEVVVAELCDLYPGKQSTIEQDCAVVLNDLVSSGLIVRQPED